ncbi:MAG: ATP-binding protein, partial [Lachnospiraceae bacterium]
MITGVKELILYRDLENGQILLDMTWILEHLEKKEQISEVRDRFFSCMHDLVELAGNYGFENNLWHNYLTFLLVNNENIFSTACEIRGVTEGSLLSLARHDFAIFRELFACDFTELERMLQAGVFEEFLHYARTESTGKLFNRRIRDRICELSGQLANAETLEAFTEYMVSFYKEFGVGKLGLHKAFRVAHVGDDVQIEPITNIAHVKLEDLVGYELQKKKLIDNTEAFVEGRSANNCLLFGDAGTGKSSSIKAILNRYYDRGLRIIEVYKHQFQDLNEVIAQIKNRNYKFIIYMDDLSFEEFEIEYKYLKAVIEGGLEKKPDNILIYATSNRRHLINESFRDKDELHGDL